LNTVVTALNAHEDLTSLVNETRPMRWKIFQVLPMGSENMGEAAAQKGHDVTSLLVSAEQFAAYVARARAGAADPSVIEPEDNTMMQASYILVDEYGRLLDTSTGTKLPTSASVLDEGVEAVAQELLASSGRGFHPEAYIARGAHYPDRWSRTRQPGATPPGTPAPPFVGR